METIGVADTLAKTHGVHCAESFADMLPQHADIARTILLRILGFARAEAEKENQLQPDAYADSLVRREPILTFLIDGVRGAGKTSLAVSLISLLKRVEHLEKGGGTSMDHTVLDRLKVPLDGLTVAGTRRTSVHALPMLKPDNMDTSETIMEALFAQMYLRLKNERDAAKKETGKEEHIRKADELIRELNSGVAKGWYFSRQLGVEALMNDSITFQDYIARRAQEASTSHDRVDVWRRYVQKYLDFFKAQTLGVFVDDTDISRHMAEDLLHSIRMFFGHPRIFAVVAANLHATRQKLLAERFSELSDAFRALRRKDSYTASFWREFERDNLEEYLAKVFPRQHRFFVSIDDRDIIHLLSGPEAEPDMRQTFANFCTDRMKHVLFDLVGAAARVRPRDSYRKAKPPGRIESERRVKGPARSIENYLALWMLNNAYAEKLTPRSARHINQFAQMVAGPEADGIDADEASKVRRVSVALFTEPLNFQVVQRLTDHDSDVHQWINAQTVNAQWRGGRALMLNRLRLTEKSLSYDYLLYRLDLEIAKPAHANKNVGFPISLLPVPSTSNVWTPELWDTGENRQKMSENLRTADRSLIGFTRSADGEGTEPVSFVRIRQEKQGLARTIANPIVPANCLYFKDLGALPDLTWEWAGEGDRRSFCRLPVRFVENCFRLDTDRPENHYFRNIVLVYASFPLLPPVPPDEFTREKDSLLDLECKGLPTRAQDTEKGKKTAVAGDGKGTGDGTPESKRVSWIEDGTALLAHLIHEASIDEAGPIRRLSPSATRLFRQESLSDTAVTLGLRREDGDAQELARKVLSIAPRYKRILDSVRGAYNALRILENDFNSYGYLAFSAQSVGSSADGEEGVHPPIERVPFKHSRNDRTRPISVAKLRQVLGMMRDDPYERYWVPEPGGGRRRPMEELFDWSEGDSPRIRIRFGRDDAAVCLARDDSGQVSCKGPEGEIGVPISEFLERRLGTPEAMHWLVGSRDGTTSDMAEEKEGHFLDTTVPGHNFRSRVLRSLLLFLWGIGPSLCSLIHLEVTGLRYSRTFGNDDERLAGLMAEWKETLIAAEAMTYIIARAFEANAQRDFTLHEKLMKAYPTVAERAERAKRFGLVFRPTPDISIATLGLRVFGTSPEEEEKEEEDNPFHGIVRDTLTRLRLAQLYLEDMRDNPLPKDDRT